MVSRKLSKEIRRAVIRTTEEKILGRKLTRREVVRFITGQPVVLDDFCGRRVFDCHRRPERFLIRWGYTARAAHNGCLEEIKRWLACNEQALRELARRLGRTRLPVHLFAALVDERGATIQVPPSEHWVKLDETNTGG